jgi:hypothetical protein
MGCEMHGTVQRERWNIQGGSSVWSPNSFTTNLIYPNYFSSLWHHDMDMIQRDAIIYLLLIIFHHFGMGPERDTTTMAVNAISWFAATV